LTVLLALFDVVTSDRHGWNTNCIAIFRIWTPILSGPKGVWIKFDTILRSKIWHPGHSW